MPGVALIGLISKDDDRAFLSQVDSFVNHCDTNYLELNVSKTKEMVIDFRQARSDPQPVDIKGSGRFFGISDKSCKKKFRILSNNAMHHVRR